MAHTQCALGFEVHERVKRSSTHPSAVEQMTSMVRQPNRRQISTGCPAFALAPSTFTSRSALAFITVVYARRLRMGTCWQLVTPTAMRRHMLAVSDAGSDE